MMRWAMIGTFMLSVFFGGGCGGGETDLKSVEEVGNFCHGLADGTPCDDGNTCTADDRCGLGVCKGRAEEDGLECDDLDLCTVEDQCLAGVCMGVAQECSGLADQCNDGICDPASGECVADPFPNGPECDDSNICTEDDRCEAGSCAGEAKDCAVDDPCMAGSCSMVSGECVTEPKAEGDACDDEDFCTEDDVCTDGDCTGQPMDCSDLDSPCYQGVCNPTDGSCQEVPAGDGTVCDDGNSCTDGETCAEGSCGGGTQVPDGNLCDDEDLCTEEDTCVAGVCMGEEKDCSDIAQSACVEGICNPLTGDCEAKPIEDPACECWQADDGTLCDDGLLCTTDDMCEDSLCIGQEIVCTSFGDVCNDGVCDPETGKCTKSPVTDGKPCGDDLQCTEADSCLAGACVGLQVSCDYLNTPCQIGLCDEEGGDCETQQLTDGTPCNDGDICTGHDDCQDGVCSGSIDLCEVCFGEDKGSGCGDGDACTVNTICVLTEDQLVCMGSNKECPQLPSPCMFSDCEPDTGDCMPKPLPDGISCNDENPCTLMDVCNAGECSGVEKDCSSDALPCAEGVCNPITGACVFETLDDGAACDDGDLCTEGEVCLGGACNGEPKECSDSAGPCVLGECDPETGECGVPLEDGSDCDDLDVCTVDDSCQDGLCTGKDICFCIDQPDGTQCNDGYPCTVDDECINDGCSGEPMDCSEKDGICLVGFCDPAAEGCVALPMQDGSPCDDNDTCTKNDVCLDAECDGVVMDCSELDSQCAVGACDSQTGECEAEPVLDDTPCDDKDFCTGNDACAAGNCVGGVNLCGTCLDKDAGDECDDGNACTVDTTCLEMSSILVCQGSPMDCTGLTDQCNVGACDADTGQCLPKPKQQDLPCDDEDPCTEEDSCQSGQCKGTAINMCGDNPVACEEPQPNDQISTAVPLELNNGAITVMGWIEPAGETDWYAVLLEEGQLLTVETRPHCDSVLDTQIGVYNPDGLMQLAVADDGGEGGWTLVEEAEVMESGVHYIGLTAYSDSGSGTYLLDVAAYFPPPCQSDDDCECSQLACVKEGELAGQCIPEMPEEVEPDDTPQQAMPIAVDADVKGLFGVEGDIDWYLLTLEKDIPVDIYTGQFCQEMVDPKLALYGELGLSVLASDADGGELGHAYIKKFVAPANGAYRLKVTEEVMMTGAYVISLRDARCKNDIDCECTDQECSGTPQSPGDCVPKLSVPEPEEPDAPPAPIVMGTRVHSNIDEAYDIDRFVVSLAPGTYDFSTLNYCGSDTDTEMSLYAPGEVLVGTDEDSGELFFAAISNVVVEDAGGYVIEVSAYGAGNGDYIVFVEESKDQ